MNKINVQDLSEIYLEVARELKLSKFLVEDTIKHFYGEVREHLTNPKFDSILIHYLGTFKINQGALKHMLREKTLLKENTEMYNQFLTLLKEKYKHEFKVEQPESINEGTSVKDDNKHE